MPCFSMAVSEKALQPVDSQTAIECSELQQRQMHISFAFTAALSACIQIV